MPTAIDNNLMAAIPNKCDSEYLYRVLCNFDFGKFVQEGAVPSVNQRQISKLKFELPTLPEQKKIAENYKKQLEKDKVFINKIVTEITELGIYYEAENYHQDYYSNNKNQPYCRYVIKPKIEKFKYNQSKK